MSAEAYVIANPRAGRGAGEHSLAAALERAGLRATIKATERPRHGEELARAARREGRPLVVAAGGDGTVHEVVNGLLADGPGTDVPILGVVPMGSGCDYVRTFGIPTDLDAAARVLASTNEPRVVDAGEVTYAQGGYGGSTASGASVGRSPHPEVTRLFVNIAEAGLGPAVVGRAARLPRALGPAMYFAAFCLTLPGYKRPTATVVVDGSTDVRPMTNLVVAIGKAFGGGMLVAPNADPGDGAFEVQMQCGSKLDYVRSIPKVYKGTHVPHARVLERRGARVEVTCDRPVLVEADGEVLGTTPATFRVLPGALRLKV